MSKSPDKTSLPSAPTLVGSPGFSQIQSLLESLGQAYQVVKRQGDEGWKKVLEKYVTWEKSPSGAHTSALNRKLQLYEFLIQAFPSLPLKNNPVLLDIILSDLSKQGEIIRMRLPDGTTGEAKVLRREITDRLGVLFAMESLEGFQFTHEFFD